MFDLDKLPMNLTLNEYLLMEELLPMNELGDFRNRYKWQIYKVGEVDIHA